MGACYLLQFPNGKVYVGITLRAVAERFAEHCKLARSGKNRPLYNALTKYGPESVTIHTLAASEDWDALQRYERMFIVFYGSNRKGVGYNSTEGGEGVHGLSEESRAKLIASSSVRANRQWADPEHREKMTRAACDRKRRAIVAMTASLDDYGEFTGVGHSAPIDYEDRVRVALQASPYGRKQLAQIAGVGDASVKRFAARKGNIQPDTLRRIAQALGVTE